MLDFHHINPATKVERIAKMVSNHYNADSKEIQEEIEKCVVLCANCHREFHYLQSLDSNLTIEKYLK